MPSRPRPRRRTPEEPDEARPPPHPDRGRPGPGPAGRRLRRRNPRPPAGQRPRGADPGARPGRGHPPPRPVPPRRPPDGRPLQTKDAAEKYSQEHKFTYTFTYANDDFARACRVQGIPMMLVVDRTGVVRKVQVGFDPNLFKVLETEILPLLDATN